MSNSTAKGLKSFDFFPNGYIHYMQFLFEFLIPVCIFYLFGTNGFKYNFNAFDLFTSYVSYNYGLPLPEDDPHKGSKQVGGLML
jgi:hypothetical protein